MYRRVPLPAKHFPRVSTKRSATATSVRDDVGVRDPHAGVAAGQQQRHRIAEHVRTDVGAEAGDVAAAVVDAEPEPAGQLGQRGLGLNGGIELDATQSRTSACPPTRPDNGEATMLRTRSWVARRQQPCGGDGVGQRRSVSVMPRIWMLPREVSSMAGEPNRVAAWASASSWSGSIIPPGSRTRASAPSAAVCTCSAPGQASWSRVRVTNSRYA